jgi:hypothetical protein
MKNTAIRRLFFLRKNWKLYVSDVTTINFSRNIHFECDALISSPFRIQCEVLAIEMKYRRNIVDLINAFVNLRLLIVKCKDDKRTLSGPQQINDELIDWFGFRIHIHEEMCVDEYVVVKTSAKNASFWLLRMGKL